MILITTPTGHIGSQLLSKLLVSKEKLRVLARDPSKLSAEVKERVEVVSGSMDNAEDLARAYANVDDLFFVIPPSMKYDNADEYYKFFGSLSLKAILVANIKRVVFVSGTGLRLDGEAGAVTSSVYVEKMLEESGVSLRVLHCGTFMENLFHSVGSIKATGQFGTSCPADIKLPWVATKDIATVAEKLMLDKAWTGFDSVGVLGPKDVSYGEIAEILSEFARKKISYQSLSADAVKSNAKKYGATEAAAQNLADIYSSMARGKFNLLERTKENSSPTDVREWLSEHRELFGF